VVHCSSSAAGGSSASACIN